MPNAVAKPGARVHRRSRIAVALLAMAMPFATWALCTCGFGDGLFTLVSINVDGNINDWTPVHADVDNNVCDGPANGASDRDAPVQSTGRDLTHFAFTWDANNVYLFTERSSSVSNTQSFVYYADADNDRLSLKIARPNDWWFHVRGLPGSHVVLQVGKQPEPDKSVLE